MFSQNGHSRGSVPMCCPPSMPVHVLLYRSLPYLPSQPCPCAPPPGFFCRGAPLCPPLASFGEARFPMSGVVRPNSERERQFDNRLTRAPSGCVCSRVGNMVQHGERPSKFAFEIIFLSLTHPGHLRCLFPVVDSPKIQDSRHEGWRRVVIVTSLLARDSAHKLRLANPRNMDPAPHQPRKCCPVLAEYRTVHEGSPRQPLR